MPRDQKFDGRHDPLPATASAPAAMRAMRERFVDVLLAPTLCRYRASAARSAPVPGLIDFRAQIQQTRPSADRFERRDRHQRVLVHRVAMVEIAHHQAFDIAPFRESPRQAPDLLHRAQIRAMPSADCSSRFQSSQSRFGISKPFRRSIGIRREAQADAARRTRTSSDPRMHCARRPQQHAVARTVNSGRGQTRSPLVKSPEQRVRLSSARLQSARCIARSTSRA